MITSTNVTLPKLKNILSMCIYFLIITVVTKSYVSYSNMIAKGSLKSSYGMLCFKTIKHLLIIGRFWLPGTVLKTYRFIILILTFYKHTLHKELQKITKIYAFWSIRFLQLMMILYTNIRCLFASQTINFILLEP